MPLIQYLSRIHFDHGAISLLGGELDRLGLRRPLLVTDQGIAESGILKQVLGVIGAADPVIYDGTTGNPTEASLDACLDLWRSEKCDGVIALGGGSPIDLSKAVALLVSQGGRFGDYDVKTGGSANIGKVAPQIAIPTAAGTGAEVGRAAIVTLHDGRKTVAVNLNMVADVVICDPDLTLGLPPAMTAATGIDALSHGIETFCSTLVNPPAEAIARDCVARAAKWLPVAVADGGNREARWEMMMAALEGGMCLQKSLGSAHAMSTPLGEFGHHHGTLMGILLPPVLAFNTVAVPERMAVLSKLVGTTEPMESWLRALVSRLGLPSRLSDLGVTRDQLPGVARKAEADHLSATNPRPAKADDYLAMLEAVF